MRLSILIVLTMLFAACGGSSVAPKSTPTTIIPLQPPPKVTSTNEPSTAPLAKLDLTGLPRIEAARERGEEGGKCDFGSDIQIVTPADRLCFRGVWTHIDLEFHGQRMTLKGDVNDFYGEELEGKIVDFFKEGPRKYTLFINLLPEAVEVDKTIDELQPLKFKGILYGPNGKKVATEFTNQPFTVTIPGVLTCDSKDVCQRIKITGDLKQSFWVKGDGRKMDVIWPYDYRYTGGHKWGSPKKMADGQLYTPMTLLPPADLAPGDHSIWISPEAVPRGDGVHTTPYLGSQEFPHFLIRVRKN